MRALQISTIFGFLLALFAVSAHGYHFFRPHDIFTARSLGRPARSDGFEDPAAAGGFLTSNDPAPDFARIIEHLNKVGRRRR